MVGQASNRTKATSLIFSGSVSSLSLFLQEMDVDRMHDDVKTEALAAGSMGWIRRFIDERIQLLHWRWKCGMDGAGSWVIFCSRRRPGRRV